MNNKQLKDIIIRFRTAQPLVHLITKEEMRAHLFLNQLPTAAESGIDAVVFSSCITPAYQVAVSNGDGGATTSIKKDVEAFGAKTFAHQVELLDYLLAAQQDKDNQSSNLAIVKGTVKIVVVFLDLHLLLAKDTMVQRKFKQLMMLGCLNGPVAPVVLVSNEPLKPEELNDFAFVVELDPPSPDEILGMVNTSVTEASEHLQISLQNGEEKLRAATAKYEDLERRSARADNKAPFTNAMAVAVKERDELSAHLNSLKSKINVLNRYASDESKYNTSLLANGLSHVSAVHAIQAAVVGELIDPTVTPKSISDERRAIIRQSGALDLYDGEEILSSVGGYASLTEWLSGRKAAFNPEAKKFGIPTPKGVLLVGVPGTGKSMICKGTGASWGYPVVKLDMGAIFNSLVGASEQNLRAALKIAEMVQPCVLWIDEIEKGLSGASRGNDSGVSSRIFGTLLTWMQDKKAQVFVMATANDITTLPPELLRKGRFDEIFFLDLPLASTRKRIFEDKIRKTGRSPEEFDLDAMVDCSAEFSGAEITTAVEEGLLKAFLAKETFGTDHVIRELRATKPLSVTSKDRIEEIRRWGAASARPAEVEVETASSSRNTRFGL